MFGVGVWSLGLCLEFGVWSLGFGFGVWGLGVEFVLLFNLLHFNSVSFKFADFLCVQCTLYTVQCTMFNVLCTMYSVHCK